jgi:cell pole-organizing protein PopZ
MSTASPLPQAQHPSLESEQRAHEPSMEEILASIRRIIADDDALPLMRRPASLVAREPAAPARRLDVAGGRAADQSQAGTPMPPSVHLVAVPAADSLDRGQPDAPVGEDPASTAVPASSLTADESENFAGSDRDYELRAALRDMPAEEAETPSAAIAPEASSPMPVAAAMRQREERDNAPLVSPSTDASVASSFQSLATSMFLRDSDLIARTARDMLRPMLKQWLDDNLPVIVERLVRAEIERVARGGR